MAFSCQSTKLKEEIVLSQTARNSLPNPRRFGIAPTDAILMFEAEFKLTPNNIKVFARKPNRSKVQVKQGSRFAFQGVDPIEFEDQYEALHFFFPFDFAYAESDSLGLEPVERHFYSNRGKDFLLAGVSWTWLDQAPAGKVIIDPTVSVDATEDVWLESAANKNNNVAGLLVGHAGGATTRKRTLVKFDLANAGIPANATILKAQLNMKYYSRAQLSGVWVDRDIRAHQLLVDWDEGEADTTFRLNGVPWATPYGAINGTDAKATAESSVFFDVNTPFPSNQTWDLTALTRAWLDGSASNYGVILLADNENVVGYDLRFRSSDDGVNNSVDQPHLEIIWTQPVKTVYFLKDHLGSVRATVDDIGQVVGYDDYDPWGLILPNRSLATGLSNIDAAKNRFTGKAWDDEFGLDWNYFGARYYDPVIGRWLGVDPLAEKLPGWSPYNYTLNNPILLTDPDGRFPDIGDFIGLAVAAVAQFNEFVNDVGNEVKERVASNSITTPSKTGETAGLPGTAPATEKVLVDAAVIAGEALEVATVPSEVHTTLGVTAGAVKVGDKQISLRVGVEIGTEGVKGIANIGAPGARPIEIDTDGGVQPTTNNDKIGIDFPVPGTGNVLSVGRSFNKSKGKQKLDELKRTVNEIKKSFKN